MNLSNNLNVNSNNSPIQNNNNNRLNIIKKVHTKFADDNMRKKCIFIILFYLEDFINEKLNEIYNKNKKKKKLLLSINKSKVSNIKIDVNKKYIKKSLAEIFSESISTKYTNFPSNKNKIFIEKILNDTDDSKKIYFKKLFNLTFLECLDYFMNKNYIEELQGLKLYNDIKNNSEELKKININIDDKDYLETLEYYLSNYESILSHKKSRKKKLLNINNI